MGWDARCCCANKYVYFIFFSSLDSKMKSLFFCKSPITVTSYLIHHILQQQQQQYQCISHWMSVRLAFFPLFQSCFFSLFTSTIFNLFIIRQNVAVVNGWHQITVHSKRWRTIEREREREQEQEPTLNGTHVWNELNGS